MKILRSTDAPFDAEAQYRAAIRARWQAGNHSRHGADGVSWKINREVIVAAGWGRAVLLQLAHPSIAAGVSQHSAFRGGLAPGVRRLRSTVSAMLALTFGTDEEMFATAARINAIHDRIRGCVDGHAHRVYSAHHPQLQRWVHATLLESILSTYELLIGPLTQDERNRYCEEAAIMEPLLSMPPGWLPRDTAQLAACMDETRASGGLAVGDTSRALARALLYPPPRRLAWPLFRALELLTVGTLPAGIRDAYGFVWTPREARAFARWTRVLRTAARWLPPQLRHWPVARRRGQPARARVGLPALTRGGI